LTDVGFVVLTILCLAYLIRELIVFPQRFGVGAMLLFGGTLLWFCYDYLTHWLGVSFTGLDVSPEILAKTAYHHCVFVFFMVLGLQINKGRWLEKVLHADPEPKNRAVYFIIVLLLFFIGMIPYLFFTVEPFYVAIWKSIWAGRSGEGAMFTAGRTGNLNYNWGGYLAQVADIGMVGAVFAAFHAIVITRQLWQQIICWFIWALWLGICFGTGARGFTVFMALPVILLMFLKHSHRAALLMRKISLRAYITTGAIALSILIVIQVQGMFRNEGFNADQFSQVKVGDLSGNEMLTTSILGMAVFPEKKQFFYDRFPGEGMIRAMPEEIYWLVIGPFPRAAWNSKPIDPVNLWYNVMTTGEDKGGEGTTISNGAVGHPYIRYGPIGVMEFGLLYGWWMAVVERALRNGMHRPMALLFTLGFATFIFRSFRDLWWHNLYPVIIGGVAIALLVKLCNTFMVPSQDVGNEMFARRPTA
jgi:hypothetical protein